MKSVKKHPPTIKTGQIWSLAGFKSSFLFSGCAKILNYFLSILTFSNEKTQNYKVVDLIEVYNLHIKIIFIQHRIEGFSIF